MSKANLSSDEQARTIAELIGRLSDEGLISPGDDKLLDYLVKHFQSRNVAKLLSEEAIAHSVFEVPNWTRSNPVVRVAIGRLRKSISSYFDDHPNGQKESYRIVLPKGATPYVLQLTLNELSVSAVERFWGAHFVGRPKNEPIVVVYTEPLFFWDNENRCLTRYLDINFEAVDAEGLRHAIEADHGPGHPALKLLPSYHYQPSGEIGARNSIIECFRQDKRFQRQSRSIQTKVSRDFLASRDFVGQNLIVLGNRRTNSLFKMLQEGRPIIVGDSGISVAQENDSLQYLDGPTNGTSFAYAVVTRRPNIYPKGVVTLIGANHGRAAEKVAEFISNDVHLQSLYESIDEIRPKSSLPDSFQILFRVPIFEFDNPREAEPVLWKSSTTVWLIKHSATVPLIDKAVSQSTSQSGDLKSKNGKGSTSSHKTRTASKRQ